MVRQSPRKKPPKRPNVEVAAVKVKKEPTEESPKKTNARQMGKSAPSQNKEFKLKLKHTLQELTATAKRNLAKKQLAQMSIKGIKEEHQEPADIPPYVPPHMMGRDLTDPLSDQTEGSNRGLQKPRFGVKVPNRNLTSPILSHSELNRELLARSRLRRPVMFDEYNQLSQFNEAGSYLFTLKMVSRLAGSMPSRTYPLKLNPDTLKLTLNDNLQLRPKLDDKTKRELALKQLNEMRNRSR